MNTLTIPKREGENLMTRKMNRPSKQVLQILYSFLSSNTEATGYEIMKLTSVSSGVVYPILGRLEEAGLLKRCTYPSKKEGKQIIKYSLTKTGKDYLDKHLFEALERGILPRKAQTISIWTSGSI